jgi:hypothetical protein
MINPATKAVSNEMLPTPSRWLQLFDPPADTVYTIEAAVQLSGVPRRTILVYCKHRFSTPESKAIPLMATGFVHCVASKRSAQSAATILPASELFST